MYEMAKVMQLIAGALILLLQSNIDIHGGPIITQDIRYLKSLGPISTHYKFLSEFLRELGGTSAPAKHLRVLV